MSFAELTDVRCYYEILGSGEPIVLIPGLGSTCELWDGAAGALSKTHSVLAFDNRGLGKSISKRNPQTLADFSADLVELLDYLQLDRAHIMGLSLGGIIAQQFAVEHPSRVDKLVLVSCTHRFEPYLRAVMGLLGQALRHFSPEYFRRTVEVMGTSPHYYDAHHKEIEKKVADQCLAGIPRAGVARQLRCLGMHDVTMQENYAITAPTLIVAGDQDMLIPSMYGQRMSREIPGSEFVLLPGCGHNPFTEQLDVVIPIIEKFLSPARKHDPAGHEAQLALEATV